MTKTKQEYREQARIIRDGLDMVEISHKICSVLQQQDFYQSENILGFYPFRNEVDLRPLYLDDSKCWYLPKVEYSSRSMTIHKYRVGDHLHQNKWGILEPVNHEEVDIRQIDIAIIPALMADKHGNRIGYGAGFYDRFIPGLRKDCLKIVTIPEELFKESLPADHWDIPTDLIVTQNSLYKIKRINS